MLFVMLALSLAGVPSTMVLPSSVAAVMVRVFPERSTGATVKNPRKVSPVANKRPSSPFLPSASVILLSRASYEMVDVVTSRVPSVTKVTSDASMVTDIIFSASAKVCSTIIQPIWFASLNCRVFEFLSWWLSCRHSQNPSDEPNCCSQSVTVRGVIRESLFQKEAAFWLGGQFDRISDQRENGWEVSSTGQ